MSTIVRPDERQAFDRVMAETFLGTIHGARGGYACAAIGVDPYFEENDGNERRYKHRHWHEIPFERAQRGQFLDTLADRAPTSDVYICPYLRTKPTRLLDGSKAIPAAYMIADLDGSVEVVILDDLEDALRGLGGIPPATGRVRGRGSRALEPSPRGATRRGCEVANQRPIVHRVAFDSMPVVRRRVIEFLREEPQITTRQAAEMLDLPTSTTRRVLEDLNVHHVIRREDLDGTDYWSLHADKAEALDEIEEDGS